MSGEVINRIIARPPQPGHAITMATLGGTSSLPLTEVYEQSGGSRWRWRRPASDQATGSGFARRTGSSGCCSTSPRSGSAR